MRKRHQYRMLQSAFIFALIGLAFFASYAGMRVAEQPRDAIPYHSGPITQAKVDGVEPPWHLRLWKWLTHDATGVFTIVLCAVTGALAVFTYRLYQATVALAEDAALTAKSEFLASHRPRIRVRQFKIISVNDDLAFVRFSAVNVGDTVAKGLTCRASPQYFDRSATLPPYIDVPFKLVATPTDLPRGHSREIEIKVIKPMLGLAERLAAGLALHVYGVLEYANENSSSHWTTGFCRQEQITDERFTAVDDPDYEYED
ncbi:hypothetical protein [uncultured Reyranella sp.]|uniref:hypothetical protein n=1 Tax=uncultured Reyranella sp. TaxID=735512 RepID=UPI0025DCAE7A|nr:hypothetical protein [uncultured Reyranella sp.]